MIDVHLRTDDGVDLALHRLDPTPIPGRSGRVLLLVHGAVTGHAVWLRGGSGAAGKGLGRYLAARGHDVWLADCRHHGASMREPRPRTWHFDDMITRDAPALVARVREETGSPPVWVGHSVGGVVGLAFLARNPAAPVSGLVALGAPGPMISPLRRMLALTTMAICYALGRFPARALRVGSEDDAALILGEWMSWNVRRRWIGLDGFDYLAALERVRTPFLAVAGAADRWFAPAAACRMLVDKVGGRSKTFVTAPSPRLDHRGLLLDDRADESCWPLVADWIARLPDLAASAARMPS